MPRPRLKDFAIRAPLRPSLLHAYLMRFLKALRALLACLLRASVATTLLAFLLPGCATVFNGRHQIVPVDSMPRGLPVTAPEGGDGVVHGTTPFFARVESGPEQEFTLGAELLPSPPLAVAAPEFIGPPVAAATAAEMTAGAPVTTAVPCTLRWLGSIGGNLALAGLFLANPWAGAAILTGGQGLDFATGAAYDCSSGVRLTPAAPQVEALNPRYCRRLLLVPPLEVDAYLSKHFASLVRKLYAHGDTGCDSFIDYDQGEEALQYLNISNLNHPRLTRIDRKHWYRLGYDLGATHVVLAEPQVQGHDLIVHLKIIDMISLQTEGASDLLLAGGAREAETGPRTRRAFAYTLAFFPNGVSYSYDLATIDNKRFSTDPNLTQQSMHDESSRSLSYLTGLSFENVEHPDGYATWDIGAGLAPSLSLLFWDARYEYTDSAASPTAAPRSESYVLHLTMITPSAMASVTGHTPIGAFSLGVGLGPSFVYGHDEEGGRQHGLLIAVKREVDYTAFLTSQTFFRLGIEGLALQGAGFSSRYFDFRGYSDIYAGIGWFLPGVKHRVMEVLDR